MTSNVQYGIAIPQRFLSEDIDTSGLHDYLTLIESLGYGSCWVVEQAANARFDLAPVPLLAYAAAATERMRLGSCVLITLVRNPVNLAKSLATLDRLSQGRVILGVGMGSRHSYPHLAAFGVDPEARGARFEEGINILRALWTGEPTTYDGRFWQLRDLFVSPRPVQSSIPIWFGGHAPVALRRAARLGDGWIGASSTSTAAFKEHLARLLVYLEEEGRDRTSYSLAKRVFVSVDRDRETALARMVPWFTAHGGGEPRARQLAVYGNADDCIEGLSDIASTGVGTIVLGPVHDMAAQAERLATEVLPHVQG